MSRNSQVYRFDKSPLQQDELCTFQWKHQDNILTDKPTSSQLYSHQEVRRPKPMYYSLKEHETHNA